MRLSALFPLAAPLLAALAVSGAWAEEGPFRPDPVHTLTVLGDPPPPPATDDALRFSGSPALGGLTFIVELRREASGEGAGRIVMVRHFRSENVRLEERPLHVSAKTYAELAALIDAGLVWDTQPAEAPPQDDEAEIQVIVCTDGPGWVSERWIAGRAATLEGFCGDDHPNDGIAAAMVRLLPVKYRSSLRRDYGLR